MSLEFTNRRRFIGGLVALVAAACTPAVDSNEPPSAPPPPVPRDPSAPVTTAPPTSPPTTTALEPPVVGLATDPFSLGVASGDPDADGLVLWTGLTGSDLPEVVPLLVEIAETGAFETIVSSQIVEAQATDNHTVRVIQQGLGPDRSVHYRFRVDDYVSRVGQARTMPVDAGAMLLAVSSCQLMETGHFAAHLDIAASDADLVVWLGDFIYEGGGSSRLEGRAHTGGEARDLAGYRARYAQYLTDPSLQSCRAAKPWVATWDDHEVVNDYDSSTDPARRLAAYRAWWEHIPTRLPPPTETGLDVFRTIDLGAVGRILLLDTRQYATEPGMADATLLGAAQMKWLRTELDTPHAGWTVLASPTLVTGLTASISGASPLLDYTFSAYPAERAELLALLATQDSVIVSGDLHAGMMLDAKPELFGSVETTAAPEFMAPAISSQFPDQFAAAAPLLPLLNTHVRFIDVANGWLALGVAETVSADYRYVDEIDAPGSGISLRAGFDVSPGTAIATQR